MANINCTTMLVEIKSLLPDSNLITDEQMLVIIKRVISDVGDDLDNYGEIACKSLRAIATVNLSKAVVEVGSTKREKVGEVELEYFAQSSSNLPWKEFIKSLNDLCPIMYGYSFKTTTGMVINTTTIPNPLCPPSYSAGYL